MVNHVETERPAPPPPPTERGEARAAKLLVT